MLNNLTSMADFLRWPDEEDLNGAATALMRLQDTYNLDTSQLARGQILGKKQAYRELTGRLHIFVHGSSPFQSSSTILLHPLSILPLYQSLSILVALLLSMFSLVLLGQYSAPLSQQLYMVRTCTYRLVTLFCLCIH